MCVLSLKTGGIGRYMRQTIIALWLGFATATAGAESTVDYEVHELERDFARAELRIVNETADISIDVREKLLSVNRRGIADFGEYWNSTDVDHGTVPRAQHLFTGESDAVAAVAYRTGGIQGATLRLLLTRRQADWFCIYYVPRRESIIDTMNFIQQLFPPGEGSQLSCRRVDVSGD